MGAGTNHIVALALALTWPKDAHVADDNLLAGNMHVSLRRLPSAEFLEPVQSAFISWRIPCRINISNFINQTHCTLYTFYTTGSDGDFCFESLG